MFSVSEIFETTLTNSCFVVSIVEKVSVNHSSEKLILEPNSLSSVFTLDFSFSISPEIDNS